MSYESWNASCQSRNKRIGAALASEFVEKSDIDAVMEQLDRIDQKRQLNDQTARLSAIRNRKRAAAICYAEAVVEHSIAAARLAEDAAEQAEPNDACAPEVKRRIYEHWRDAEHAAIAADYVKHRTCSASEHNSGNVFSKCTCSIEAQQIDWAISRMEREITAGRAKTPGQLRGIETALDTIGDTLENTREAIEEVSGAVASIADALADDDDSSA